ncbi:MAG: FtsX-like permease family protein [Lachnospiraceae bacterium]|nr:FtsX-like permease family protein [Lachnospiraceae bacterium]
MGIVIKHCLKNIFSKPARLLVLIVCIFFASFTALLAFDMKNNIESLFKGYMMDMIGKMDIIVMGASVDTMDGVDGMADMTRVGIASAIQYEYERDPEHYEYTFEKTYNVNAFSDISAAENMAVIPAGIELSEDSAVINRKYADEFHTAIGDTLDLECRDESRMELRVTDIIDIDNALISGSCVLVSSENLQKIACLAENESDVYIIDVSDDSKIKDVADAIKQNDPRAEVESVSDFEEEGDIEQMYNLFYLLFLISFLLVVFVTMSFAEKIVNERMSVIGTLRSLGVNPTKTALLLLCENIIYALIGTAMGSFLYAAVKKPLLMGMMNFEASKGTFDPAKYIGDTPLAVYLIIVAGAMIVECAYPLYELSKAAKTAIRDIIFENKDTEFRYSWKRLYIGLGLLIISIICAFLTKNFATLAVSLTTGIVALALLIPFIIRVASGLLGKLFGRMNMPIAALAAGNIARNRMIMGTAVLCITSLILSALIGGVGAALNEDLLHIDYDCDLIVDVIVSGEDTDYRFLEKVEGVDKIDILYGSHLKGKIGGGKEENLTIYADTDHGIFNEFPEGGYGLLENEIVLADKRADKLGLMAGDTVDIVFSSNTDFPYTRSYVLKDTLNVKDSFVLNSDMVILNADVYKRTFSNSISSILVSTSDPEGTKKMIEKTVQTGYMDVKTPGEIMEDNKGESVGLRMVLTLVVAGSAALTLVGITGNQSLSFVTRKRETALLYSVALGRGKLKRLLFLESLFSMGLSALAALITAPFLYGVLGHLLNVITESEENILHKTAISMPSMLAYLGVVFALYLMTTLIPIKYLRKMNIAEELKYE